MPKPVTQYRYSDTPETLAEVLNALQSVRRVAMDTEADSLHHYYEKVCLIQLSFAGENWLIDPLAGLDLSGLFDVLVAKELILHYAFSDLKMLHIGFGFEGPKRFFDTMVAAELLGYTQFSLAALVERHFGVVLAKARQKSNWANRPLTDSQLIYAANDTAYLEGLADILGDELRQAGRLRWHDECCQAMQASTKKNKNNNGNLDKWRIKGVNGLTPRQLALIRELWQWREEQARRWDIPAFKIMNNSMMINAVQAYTDKNAKAYRIKLPNYCGGQEAYAAIESCLRRGMKIPESQCPEPLYRIRPKPDGPEYLQLQKQCNELAQSLQIAPSVLAPRRAMELMVQERPRNVEEIVEKCGLLRWQAELIHHDALKVFAGR